MIFIRRMKPRQQTRDERPIDGPEREEHTIEQDRKAFIDILLYSIVVSSSVLRITKIE